MGKNRATACVDKLAELNNYVKVSSSTEELTDNFLKQFQVSYLRAVCGKGVYIACVVGVH